MHDTRAFPCAQARQVWLDDHGARENQYAQFLQSFSAAGTAAKLLISCDSRARVCLNGKLCGLVLYDGTEDTGWYDVFDLSDLLIDGENQLSMEVWYQGVPTNN